MGLTRELLHLGDESVEECLEANNEVKEQVKG